MSTREAVSITEAMRRCGVARRTIYNWLHAGKLETCETPSGRTRIYADCLLRPSTWTARKDGAAHREARP
jgi:predicted site-specific integrase-resolvase